MAKIDCKALCCVIFDIIAHELLLHTNKTKKHNKTIDT